MSKTKTQIETPGGGDGQIKTLSAPLDSIDNRVKTINEAIALNQAIVDDPQSAEDAKNLAQIKITELNASKAIIDSSLAEANALVNTLKNQIQTKSANTRKTDLTAITINKSESNTVTGPNITLTEAGYVITERAK